MIDITRQNVEQLLSDGLIFVAMRNGNWWRIRRNGATKRWKRDASRIYIPFKAGLKSYGALTETDFMPDNRLNSDYYRHADDVPAKKR